MQDGRRDSQVNARTRATMELEWKSGLCGKSVVHVRVYLWHGVAHSLLRHAFTCRHKATAPDATQAHTRDMRHTACSGVRGGAGACVRSVGALCFSARGEMRRTVASSGAHRPHPSLREHPPRCLAHTPHAPALVPPVVDHLPCRGGVSLRSRSACAAQQGRPIPISPERSKKTAKEGKTLPRGPQTRSRNFSFRTSQQSKLVSNMHHALRRARRTGSLVSPLQQSACRRS